MTNTDLRTRFWARLGMACIASLAASCADRMAASVDSGPADPAVTGVDPIGTWSVRYTYGASCHRPPLSESRTFTVTPTSTGYAVDEAGVTTPVTLSCTPDSCALSGTFSWSVAAARFQMSLTMALDASDGITGSGTELIVEGAATCSYAFVIEGMKT